MAAASLSRGTSSPLRIAVVHSFYRSDSPSGENAMVDAQVAALLRRGHEVRLFAAASDDVGGPLGALRQAVTVATGAGRAPVRDWAPDVVHLHNTFPNLGRRWTARLDVPLVATLHNYRPLCAAATLYRDGAVCTECVDSGRHRGLVHGCYRGSRLATLPLTLGQRGADDPVLRSAAVLTALSPSQAERFVAAGVPAERLRVLPNFVPDDLAPAPGPGGHAWLYAGRLTADKGIADAVHAWPAEIPLVVVGDGPAADDVRAAARGKQVDVRPPLSRPEVLDLLGRSRGLVFPSRWPDPFGLVYAEALAAGTPVLATHPSAAAAMAGQDGAGLAVDAVTPELVRRAHADFAGGRPAARRAFEARYTEAAHVAALEEVYAEAIGVPTTRSRRSVSRA
ncbi:glycosyltransferase family 4 protein [Petropleomorpha daqingensis]|uniref:Glycosyltransferase involved in cell wall biosynthesis n=1 Tax=Petropleomorpha daqingensis TaxID=2026353 RepID=A0A853CFD4_9ACTN|nr:glycosyltransferase family 4 protein [Petropleomorpha daqingensis]NYJ05876.1 glycosyltransferase involved in cell wall biosynthesis [Petropleomorpha daqingensis]